MSDADQMIVINATKEAAEAIRSAIEAQPGSRAQASARRNIDGSTATWIVVANLSLQALPHIIGLIKHYLPNRQVTKIKWGDREVENPTPELIDRLLEDGAERGGK